MSDLEKAKAIAAILKKRFNNLTVQETLELAFAILEVVNNPNPSNATAHEILKEVKR